MPWLNHPFGGTRAVVVDLLVKRGLGKNDLGTLPVTGIGALASAPACQYCIRTSEAEECRDKSD